MGAADSRLMIWSMDLGLIGLGMWRMYAGWIGALAVSLGMIHSERAEWGLGAGDVWIGMQGS